MGLDWLKPLWLLLGLSETPQAIDEAALAVDEPVLAAAEVDAVTGRILQGVYQAFSGESEGAVYDGLARFTDGELLSDLYLQQRRAAAFGQLSGVAAEIVEVELFESSHQTENDGYRVDAGWRVVGRLAHESHSHERINLYAASLSIRPVAGQWRLTAFDLNQVERVDPDDFLGGE